MSNDIYADKIIPVSSNQVSINSSVNVTGNITCVSPETGVSSSVLLSNDFAKYNYGSRSGLLPSNSSGDTDHDITISAGYCVDSTSTYVMKLTSPITKRIDAAWSAGDNGGFLDTGSVAINTQYAVWLIRKDSDGTSDAVASTSFTSPSMPGGYTYKRLLRGFATDGSANIVNNQWLITDVVNDRSAHLTAYDQKAKNTASDAYASGAWRTHVITTIGKNEIPGASLASNQITLPAGTYTCAAALRWKYSTDQFVQIKLYNTTGAADLIMGTSDEQHYNISNINFLDGMFTLAVSSVVEIQLYGTQNVLAVPAANIDVEIYLMSHFQKIG